MLKRSKIDFAYEGRFDYCVPVNLRNDIGYEKVFNEFGIGVHHGV